MNKSIVKDHAENFVIKLVLLVIAVPFVALGVVWLPFLGLVVAFGLLILILAPFGTRREVHIMVGVEPSVGVHLAEAESSDAVAVAIFSDSAAGDVGKPFDATRIRTDSVRFGPGEAKPIKHPEDPSFNASLRQDVNDDGVVDLILYFIGNETGVSENTDTVCLTGETLDGEYFTGCSHLQHAV